LRAGFSPVSQLPLIIGRPMEVPTTQFPVVGIRRECPAAYGVDIGQWMLVDDRSNIDDQGGAGANAGDIQGGLSLPWFSVCGGVIKWITSAEGRVEKVRVEKIME
jgi:hypothetical protein